MTRPLFRDFLSFFMSSLPLHCLEFLLSVYLCVCAWLRRTLRTRQAISRCGSGNAEFERLWQALRRTRPRETRLSLLAARVSPTGAVEICVELHVGAHSGDTAGGPAAEEFHITFTALPISVVAIPPGKAQAPR